MSEYLAARKKMIDTQIKARGVKNPLILEAMLTIPRELFVREQDRSEAYADKPLPISHGQTISQPFIVALMIDFLRLSKKGGIFLEIGAGSGYSAAVLGQIAEKVFSIERHHGSALEAQKILGQLNYKNIFIVERDGTLGLPEKAPFDGIIVTAGGPEIPSNLLQQLKVGGRLIIPVGNTPRTQTLVAVTRQSEIEFIQENIGSVQFVPLIGEQGWKDDNS